MTNVVELNTVLLLGSVNSVMALLLIVLSRLYVFYFFKEFSKCLFAMSHLGMHVYVIIVSVYTTIVHTTRLR